MARISKLRGRESFRRRPGHKPPRSITLIVCEGETERVYFDVVRIHFGLTNAEVVIADNTAGPAPISVVECAEKRGKERGGYDKIFCVFDRNGHTSFDKARRKIKSLANRKRMPLPLEEIISVPCFEVWVLLHFEQTDAPFGNCDEVINRVRDRHMPGYEKADAKVARRLMQDLAVARTNAEWLAPRAAQNNCNPYTAVHRVILHFESVSRRQVS